MFLSSKFLQQFVKILIFYTRFADNLCMEIDLFWERVQNLCKKSGITQRELSEKMGYGARNLEIKIQRNSLPNVAELKKLSEIFDVSFDFLIDGLEKNENREIKKADNDKFFVPVLNQKLSAGYGRYLQEEPKIIGYMEVPRYLKQYGERLGLLYVDGDSMEPTLRRGDLVLCDSCGYSGEGLYAIIRDGDGYVKRVYKDSGKFIIKSDNPMYPTKEEPQESENLGIVGRVHYVIKHID